MNLWKLPKNKTEEELPPKWAERFFCGIAVRKYKKKSWEIFTNYFMKKWRRAVALGPFLVLPECILIF